MKPEYFFRQVLCLFDISTIMFNLYFVIYNTYVICKQKFNAIYCFEVEAYYFEFTKHVSDEQHPSSVANTNEPLFSSPLYNTD